MHRGHVIQQGSSAFDIFPTYPIRPYLRYCQVIEHPGYTFDLKSKRSLFLA